MFKYDIDDTVFFLQGLDVKSGPITGKKEYKTSGGETYIQYYVEMVNENDGQKEIVDVLLYEKDVHTNEEDAKVSDEDKESMIKQIVEVIESFKTQITSLEGKILDIKNK